jgi:hypothetical protein
MYDPIAARSDWQTDRERIAREIVALLTPLAVADYNHQVGPRGVGEYPSFKEVTINLRNMMTQVSEEVERNVQEHMLERRKG